MRPFVVARSVRGQERSGVGSCSCLCRGYFCTARHEELPKCRLEDRFGRFAGGQSVGVVNVSSLDADMASVTTSRRRHRERQDDLDRRAPALHLVHLGEVSSARQALEGTSAALGTLRTLAAVTHPARRPPEARAYLDNIVMETHPVIPFDPCEVFEESPHFETWSTQEAPQGRLVIICFENLGQCSRCHPFGCMCKN